MNDNGMGGYDSGWSGLMATVALVCAGILIVFLVIGIPTMRYRADVAAAERDRAAAALVDAQTRQREQRDDAAAL